MNRTVEPERIGKESVITPSVILNGSSYDDGMGTIFTYSGTWDLGLGHRRFSIILTIACGFSWTHGLAGQKNPGVELGSEVVREVTRCPDHIQAMISTRSNNSVVSSREWMRKL